MIALLASRGVRTTTRSLLAVEIVAVVLILALMAVIFVKLATGDAPRGLGYTSDFLHVPSGVGASTLVFAASAGFLSFAGFEAAGSFGEESRDPKHTIPRSIIVAIAFGSVFYVICMVGADARLRDRRRGRAPRSATPARRSVTWGRVTSRPRWPTCSTSSHC